MFLLWNFQRLFSPKFPFPTQICTDRNFLRRHYNAHLLQCKKRKKLAFLQAVGSFYLQVWGLMFKTVLRALAWALLSLRVLNGPQKELTGFDLPVPTCPEVAHSRAFYLRCSPTAPHPSSDRDSVSILKLHLIKWRPACLYYVEALSNHQAAVTKYLRLSDLRNTDVFSHSSRGWKFKFRMPVGFVSGETSLPGLLMTYFLLCHLAFGLRVWGQISGVSSCLYKDISPMGLRLHPGNLT